jgi:hypothetical protein
MIVVYILFIINILWFTLSTPSFLYDGLPPLAVTSRIMNLYLLNISITLIGFFWGFVSPIFYEFSAELTFPIPEGFTSGAIVFMINFAAFLMIFASSIISYKIINSLMFLVAVIGLLIIIPLNEKYNRPKNT